MASLRTLVEQRREDIKATVARHHGRRVRLFGSVARGQEGVGSDIDLLVDFEPESSLGHLGRGCNPAQETTVPRRFTAGRWVCGHG
jgi:predicted nucleotidyltransferase